MTMYEILTKKLIECYEQLEKEPVTNSGQFLVILNLIEKLTCIRAKL